MVRVEYLRFFTMKMIQFFFFFSFALTFTLTEPAMAQSGGSIDPQIIVGGIVVLIFFYIGMSIKTISGNTAFAVVSTFGEYTRVIGPGLHLIWWIFQEVEEIFPSTQVAIGVSQLKAAVRGETPQEYEIRTTGLSSKEKLKNPRFTQPGEVTIESPTILVTFPKVGALEENQLIEIAKVWPSVPGEFATEGENSKFQKSLRDIFGDFLEDIYQEAIQDMSWYSIYLERQEVVSRMNTILETRVSSGGNTTSGTRDPVYLLSLIPPPLIQLTTGKLSIPVSYRDKIENLGNAALEAAAQITLTEGERKRIELLLETYARSPEQAQAIQRLDVLRNLAAGGKLNLNEFNLSPAAMELARRIITS